MNINQAYLSTVLGFATLADLATFDCSGLVEGVIAVVVGQFIAPDVDPGGNPCFMYLPTSEKAEVASVCIATANSNEGALPGRWVVLNWTFA